MLRRRDLPRVGVGTLSDLLLRRLPDPLVELAHPVGLEDGRAKAELRVPRAERGETPDRDPCCHHAADELVDGCRAIREGLLLALAQLQAPDDLGEQLVLGCLAAQTLGDGALDAGDALALRADALLRGLPGLYDSGRRGRGLVLFVSELDLYRQDELRVGDPVVCPRLIQKILVTVPDREVVADHGAQDGRRGRWTRQDLCLSSRISASTGLTFVASCRRRAASSKVCATSTGSVAGSRASPSAFEYSVRAGLT